MSTRTRRREGWLSFLAGFLRVAGAPGGSAARAAELPVPCSPGACGSNGPLTWVSSGAATATATSNHLTINQTSNNVLLNWSSFNISADGHVSFVQPGVSSIALNRIFQDSPSRIFGQLTANGQVYLVNPNGMIFGATAKVSAAGILASTLNMSDSVYANGLLSALAAAQPALASDGRLSVINAAGQPVLGADGKPLKVQLVVQQGAELATNQPNGRILLAGQEVENAGSISAPDGQVILAAGDKVYLQASTDPALRGLLVEVDAGGTAWNQLSGQLQAARGDITMIGLAVNQDGRVSASTTVAANGSIRLLARDSAKVTTDPTGNSVAGTRGGVLSLGSSSITEVLPELSDTGTAVDDQAQLPSSIEFSGRQVLLAGGSRIDAPGGRLNVSAATDPATLNALNDPLAKIQVDSGAVIDLAGSDAVLPVTANLVDVQLRANELRDSPDQRDGALRGQTVTVDARMGTQVADVSGAVAALPKNIAQRTSQGGTATFSSNGSIVVGEGASIDVSGGTTTFTGANVDTSALITADGRVVDISTADETTTYVGVLNPSIRILYDKWGVAQTFSQGIVSHYEAGYVEGSSAGTVQFQAPALAMAGTLLARATNGPYQRDPGSALYAQGGNLLIGSGLGANGDFRAPDVILGSAAPLPATSLPTADTPLVLDAAQFVDGGFTRFGVWSNGTIRLPADAPLALADGSSLILRGNRVELLSSVTDLGGRIDAASITTMNTAASSDRSGVALGAGAALDVRGTWINDTEVLDPERPTGALMQNGGSIGLSASTAGSELSLGDRAMLLADGGAWLSRSAKLQGGKGGAITLLANGQDAAFKPGAGVGVEAFGVNLAAGGSLSLAAGRLLIAPGAQWATAQGYDPSAPDSTNPIQIGTALFSNLGFAKFYLTASGGTDKSLGDALAVAGGTQVNVVTSTWLLDDASYRNASGGTVADSVSAMVLPDYQRAASSVTLSVSPWAGFIGGRPGDLHINSGAQLRADPGSTINLASTGGSIVVDGSLTAHGGVVTAVVNPPKVDTVGYDPGLQVRIGPTAVIDVGGASLLQPNDAGILRGTVLPGGLVRLVANRGLVSIAQGAVLDVSGTSAALDIPQSSSSQAYEREVVASNAGELDLVASEWIALDGAMRAQPGIGTSGRAAGGTLSVTLTRDSADIQNSPILATTFPTAPRTIELVPGPIGTGVNGLVPLDVPVVTAAGFDDLRVRADDRVTIDTGVQASMGRRIELDAPAIAMYGGGRASLSAPYVSLGYSKPLDSGAVASTGLGQLGVNADFIDIVGSSALQNIGSATFRSSGDIELRGTVRSAAISGTLGAAGNLTLDAARVYASSATQFTINDAGYDVSVARTGSIEGLPLTADSALTIAANNIDQAGTLLAPFGRIELDATGRLSLHDGSLTSVSGDGALLPYGKTVNGKDWVYDAGTATALIVDSVPARRVILSADDLNVAKGATVDISGGGELHAFEWVKGTGGSLDALSPDHTNLYAVLPALGANYAAYDAQDYRGTDLQPGAGVYLSGGGGLPAGFYTLLPARYALLPGAYLISQVAGSTDLQPGQQAALANGTPVVAGYYSFDSTGLGGTRYQGFSIMSGSEARQLAEYSDTYASQFFAGSGATTADAGALVLNAGARLSALGTVDTAPGPGGRGAGVDISAADLIIVGQETATNSGGVELQASVLNQWHASRLLIGGQHSTDGQTISVTADQVTLDGGAQLTADEVVLVANSTVTLMGASRIASNSSTAAHAPSLATGDGPTLAGTGAATAAFLGVSDLSDLVPQRPADTGGAGGYVGIEAGSSVETRGALTIDAPGGAQLVSTMGGEGAHWSVGGRKVVVGGIGDAGSVNFDDAALAELHNAATLRLAGTDSIDFEAGIQLGTAANPLDELDISAARLTHSGAESINLYARTIDLNGLALGTGAPATVGQGNLNLVGTNIDLSGASLTINGFATTRLQAFSQITARDAAQLAVGGDLQLAAAALGAGGAANSSLQASGDVTIDSVASSTPLPAAELGGGLRIAGANVIDNAKLVARSGLVVLDAEQDLTIGQAAVIDVSGSQVTAAGQSTSSSGGAIRLGAGGDLTAATGSRLDVSGAGSAAAGQISVGAGGKAELAGTLLGKSTGQESGGAFELQAGELANFSALSAGLNHNGFTSAQQIHVASGDLVLAAGTVTRAHDVSLVTDQGAVSIAGEIDAPGTAERSSIRVYGGSSVTLVAGGALHADSAQTHGRGGSIELGVGPAGVLTLEAGSVVSASGAEPGDLRLRAPAVAGNDIAISALGSELSRAGGVTLEAVLPAFAASAAPDQVELDSYAQAANDYVAGAAGVIQSRLDPLARVHYALEPGIELQRNGDLDLGALELSGWRFGGSPAALTVRATGKVTLVGTVSDGFVSDGTGQPGSIDLIDGASSTLRLVAGSDLASADPLTLDRNTASDLVIAPGVQLRTGTGNLELAASQDVLIGSGASVYTGGLAAIPTQHALTGEGASFATGGGNLRLTALRDVVGTPVVQSVTGWLTRLGSTTEPVRWGTDISQFAWNLATLGGGNLEVQAGRDVTDLSAATADSAVVAADHGSITNYGGGALRLEAANDINGGVFYVARGVGALDAGGAVRTSEGWTYSGTPLGIFLNVGDARVDIAARTGVAVAGAVNPTALRRPTLSGRAPYFLGYGPDSSLDLSSAAGDVDFSDSAAAFGSFLDTVVAGGSGGGLNALPVNLHAAAFSGDLRVSGNGYLSPAAAGQLNLFAARDLLGIEGATLSMSDAPVITVPTALAPQSSALNDQLSLSATGARHLDDPAAASVTAGRDIIGLGLNLPKAVKVAAGRDILDSSLNAQNMRSTDLTKVVGGRDIVFTGNGGGISVGGPGHVDIEAGRTVDLGISGGITTTGNLKNANLPGSQGAALSVLAGTASGVDYVGFVTGIVAKSETGGSALVTYMESVLGSGGMTLEQALAAYKVVPADLQRPFALQQFFVELVASGREANAGTGAGFERGYAAIDALLPGSRSATSPYAGDINLDFSRIYTLSGGDVTLLAPGGLVNVGLAVPPANAAVRNPSDLGIVAQKAGDVDIYTDGDVLVNASRIFTLLGGNIAIWSTLGNIDAGRGAKSSLSAPPPTVLVDSQGNVRLDFSGAIAGSGIRTIATSADVPAGDVDLMAPAGFVNAGDAGIGAAGNINIAAARVIGADNIQFGGSAVGVPAETGGLGASLAAVASVGSSANNVSAEAVSPESEASKSQTQLSQTALSWLEVFVLGLGEDSCKPDDLECLKRQKP